MNRILCFLMFAIIPRFTVIDIVNFFLCLNFGLLLLKFHSFQSIFSIGFVKFNFGLFLLLIVVLSFLFLVIIFNLIILIFHFLLLIFIFSHILLINHFFHYLLLIIIILFLYSILKFNF